VGKFDPNEPISAVTAIVKGAHHDHGTAIYFTQGKRRCLLLDTLYGLTEEESLWYPLASWAKPQKEPGQLHYQAEFSHVLENYWNYLDDPQSHPDCSESDFSKSRHD
jgi:hypothetical protein